MAIDYIATVAASILLLRLGGYGGTDCRQHNQEDRQLIDISMDILKRISRETKSHVAIQGCTPSERLVRFRCPDGISSAVSGFDSIFWNDIISEVDC
jgi:hypothetical protein